LITAAAVSVQSPDTGLRRSILTNEAGIYEIPSLPVGSYSLTIAKPGFETFKTDRIDLLFGQTRTIDARLTVGNVSNAVEVTATAEAVNRTNAEPGGVVEAPQIREIPIDGRNWATLMTLAPGAVNTGDGAQRSINFNGHSLDDSNFTFDGIDTSGVQEQTQKADTRLNVSLDSIQEFRVSSAAYTAESGAAGGAQINVVSKTGTNDYHGSVFEYLRNNLLDARSPFDPTDIPPFRLNQFGAQFGGAIVKNKAFFFANYEGLRQELTNTMIGFVPNDAFRARWWRFRRCWRRSSTRFRKARFRWMRIPTRSQSGRRTPPVKIRECCAWTIASRINPHLMCATTSTMRISTTPAMRWAPAM
jgi:hypothetical protein